MQEPTGEVEDVGIADALHRSFSVESIWELYRPICNRGNPLLIS